MKRILIIRPTAIGDIVMASPMIPVLRAAWPAAKLVWLAEPSMGDLLRHHPMLDEVIYWSKNHCNHLLRRGRMVALTREMHKVTQALRKYRFDLALDAQGLLRSRLLARLSGAPLRIGFTSAEPGAFLMTRIISRGPRNQRMSSEYHYMMEMLNLDPGVFRPHIHLGPTDQTAAAELMQQGGLQNGFVACCPFTTRPQKHWTDHRWASLADTLLQRYQLPVALLGGPGDRQHAECIAALAKRPLVNLTGYTTLGQSAAMIASADLVLGVDTGLTHMGPAFDRPTVALFGATCPYLQTPSGLTKVIYNRYPCSPCRRRPICGTAYTCMDSIRVDQVLEVVDNLRNRSEKRSCASCI